MSLHGDTFIDSGFVPWTSSQEKFWTTLRGWPNTRKQAPCISCCLLALKQWIVYLWIRLSRWFWSLCCILLIAYILMLYNRWAELVLCSVSKYWRHQEHFCDQCQCANSQYFHEELYCFWLTRYGDGKRKHMFVGLLSVDSSTTLFPIETGSIDWHFGGISLRDPGYLSLALLRQTNCYRTLDPDCRGIEALGPELRMSPSTLRSLLP